MGWEGVLNRRLEWREKKHLPPWTPTKTNAKEGDRNRCGEGLLNTLNFRREHQFNSVTYSNYTWIGNPTSDICPLALHHREAYTLSRTRRDRSVTHREDYKPSQSLFESNSIQI